MKFTFTLFFSAIAAISVVAQNSALHKYCGSTEADKQLRSEYPELVPLIEQEQEKLEKQTQEFAKSGKAKTAGQVYIIPVVFHVLHDYGTENISDAQIQDAIRILNNDFRKLNSDTSQVISAFQPIVTDAEIEFRLAQKDPSGNCTNGIDRIWTNETYRGSDESKLNQWSRSKYLNIWTVKDISSGAAGYSFLPASVSSSVLAYRDGIMVLANYVGSIGTSNVSRSRTLTHETGHYLNLYHTWGQGNNVGLTENCDIDDYVDDTPNTIGQSGGCNTAANTCGFLDNVQNYMNYADCSIMFTAGQATRMRAALNSSTASRNNLWATANITATGVNQTPALCAADFYTFPTVICAGNPVQFADVSYNSQPDSWQWNFTGATPTTATDSNPTVTYSAPGTYTVSLTAGSWGNTFSTTKTSYITVLPAVGAPFPYSEGFEIAAFPNSDWFITNPDNSNFKWTLVSNTAYSGTKCLKMNNYGNDTIEKDELISSVIDLSNVTAATVTFKLAYCQRTSETDKLMAYISSNCGLTWSPKFAKSGSNLATKTAQNTAFTPSSTSQWAEFSFNLTSAYFGPDFRMKFTFEADGGNNLYLDDINITGTTNAIEEFSDGDAPFHIYPNPTDGNFNLKVSEFENLKMSEIEIYNMLGKSVFKSRNPLPVANKSQTGGEHSRTISMNLPEGIYFVKLIAGEKSFVKKLVVIK